MNGNKKEVFLGFDTSCYTTSLAIIDNQEQLIANEKTILAVKAGKKGLAQSEMVFEHTRNLPELIEKLSWQNFLVRAIGVSARPRPLVDSYMPAFLVGKGMARSLAQILNVPLYTTSHQENHLYAGLWSAGLTVTEPVLLVHLSGGTTEFIKVQKNSDKARMQLGDFNFNLLAATGDISAGQFIDRVGVALGLKFPAGSHLEKLAQQAKFKNLEIPIAVRKGQISFSGPCTAALRLLAVKDSPAPAELAYAVIEAIAISLYRSLRYLAATYNLKKVLLVGGVASNIYIRDFLQKSLLKYNLEVYWAQPEFSTDNAVGCAVLAKRKWNGENA